MFKNIIQNIKNEEELIILTTILGTIVISKYAFNKIQKLKATKELKDFINNNPNKVIKIDSEKNSYNEGFTQRTNTYEVGQSLTYGYRNLILTKHTNNNIQKNDYFTHFVGRLEYLVGEEEFKNLYITNDLEGLITFLNENQYKYDSFEIIKTLDYLYEKTKNSLNKSEKKLVLKVFNELEKFLIEIKLSIFLSADFEKIHSRRNILIDYFEDDCQNKEIIKTIKSNQKK